MPVPPKLVPRQWLIPKGLSRDRVADQVQTFVAALDHDKAWRVTVEEHKATRSSQQNKFLWAACYKALSDAVGYETEEVAEYLLGTYFGWKEVKVPKKPSNPAGIESRPRRTTTTDEDGKRRVLSKQEFSDYVAFIQRFAASKGVHIADPDEHFAEQEAA